MSDTKADVLRFIDAIRLRKEGKFLEAAKLYETLADSNLPNEDIADALYWTGYCYHEAALTDSNLFNKSVAAFKRLIRIANDGTHTIEVYYHLAAVYRDWAQVPGNKLKWQSVIDTVEKANVQYAGIDGARSRGWISRILELKEIAIQRLKPPSPDFHPVPDPHPLPDTDLLIGKGYIHLEKGEIEKATRNARQAFIIKKDSQRANQLLTKIKETYYARG